MFNKVELEEKGFIPKKGYKLGAVFPDGFSLPQKISNDEFKKIPLYIQVRYEYKPNNGFHMLVI